MRVNITITIQSILENEGTLQGSVDQGPEVKKPEDPEVKKSRGQDVKAIWILLFSTVLILLWLIVVL